MWRYFVANLICVFTGYFWSVWHKFSKAFGEAGPSNDTVQHNTVKSNLQGMEFLDALASISRRALPQWLTHSLTHVLSLWPDSNFIRCDTWSDIRSDIQSDIRHSIRNPIWHSIWHLIWHSIPWSTEPPAIWSPQSSGPPIQLVHLRQLKTFYKISYRASFSWLSGLFLNNSMSVPAKFAICMIAEREKKIGCGVIACPGKNHPLALHYN